MARPGPKPPLDGEALEFALDCARLASAEPASAAKGVPFDDVPNDELRELAARYYRRTVDPRADEHWMHAGVIPASLLARLARLQAFLHANVLRRMDHPGGFEIDPNVAVALVHGLLQRKLPWGYRAERGAPWSVERIEHPAQLRPRRPTRRERERLEAMHARGVILEVPEQILPPAPPAPLLGPQALRSRLPEVAVLWLLTTARYWPFAGCARCNTVFVPNKRGQRYCSDDCRRAHDYTTRMLAPTTEAERRRKEASARASKHARAKRDGTWTRVRAPGAGRPRKEK
ncbi:MAG: hypothetical protein AB1689_26670 [Thermodesulfobacteriota bacterium]